MEIDLGPGSVFQLTADEFALTGHNLEPATQGKHAGHLCIRCKQIHANHHFNKWLTGRSCVSKAKGLERKAAFENEFNRKAKEARIAKEVYTIFDTDSEDDLNSKQPPTTVRPTPQKPTASDQEEVTN